MSIKFQKGFALFNAATSKSSSKKNKRVDRQIAEDTLDDAMAADLFHHRRYNDSFSHDDYDSHHDYDDFDDFDDV